MSQDEDRPVRPTFGMEFRVWDKAVLTSQGLLDGFEIRWLEKSGIQTENVALIAFIFNYLNRNCLSKIMLEFGSIRGLIQFG